MRVLITGITGFVGRHLLEHLHHAHQGAEIAGFVRASAAPPPSGRGFAPLRADLHDARSVEAALSAFRPDRIVHLAARSSVAQSWSDPEATLRTNLHGLLHLLQAVQALDLRPRLLIVGSADEYGVLDPARTPVDEDAPLRPRSPYAVSKVAQGYLALQYALAFGLHVVRTRTFPHTGPGRGEHFAESSFARQIAEIEAGHRPPVIAVGNLDAVRDYADVRDVVQAYALLLEHGAAGEVYNVCRGEGITIGAVLQRLIALSGCGVEVTVDPARLRPSDLPVLVGNPRRLVAATGWTPQHTLDQTLQDLLAYWRTRVHARPSP